MPRWNLVLSTEDLGPSNARVWGPPMMRVVNRTQRDILESGGGDTVHLVQRAKVEDGRGLAALTVLSDDHSSPLDDDIWDLITQAFQVGLTLPLTHPQLARKLQEAMKVDPLKFPNSRASFVGKLNQGS